MEESIEPVSVGHLSYSGRDEYARNRLSDICSLRRFLLLKAEGSGERVFSPYCNTCYNDMTIIAFMREERLMIAKKEDRLLTIAEVAKRLRVDSALYHEKSLYSFLASSLVLFPSIVSGRNISA
jgi:hypothetical protein